jgi:hypothetical protein
MLPAQSLRGQSSVGIQKNSLGQGLRRNDTQGLLQGAQTTTFNASAIQTIRGKTDLQRATRHCHHYFLVITQEESGTKMTLTASMTLVNQEAAKSDFLPSFSETTFKTKAKLRL